MNSKTNLLHTYTGAGLFVEWLKQRNIRFVFLVPGAQMASLLDVLATTKQIQTIIANHELGAAYMADGCARITKKPAVCISIGGPGASNMLTAAITARMDNSRVLFITGDVAVDKQGIGAFQDDGFNTCRDNGLFQTALHYTYTVIQAKELSSQLDQAWDVMSLYATPAHISIPKNVFTQHSAQQCIVENKPCPVISVADLQEVITTLNKAKRILMVVGQRLYAQKSEALLKSFVTTYALPMVTTLGAKGIMPETDLFNFGNFGYGGNPWADSMIFTEDIDLLLVLGTDLNEKDTLGWDKRLKASNRQLVRIDTIATPASHPYQPDIELIADSFFVLATLIKAKTDLQALRDTATFRLNWLNDLKYKTTHKTLSYATSKQAIPLIDLINTLQQLLPDDSILVADAGTHRQLSGCYWQVKQSDSFFNAATTAPMGWGIAAAVGIQLTQPKRKIVALTGDGCMRMHGMELATAVRYQIPVLFIICNNAAYACTSAHLQAKSYFMLQLPAIDWVGFAESIGMKATKVHRQNELALAIKHAQTINQPFVIEVITPSFE